MRTIIFAPPHDDPEGEPIQLAEFGGLSFLGIGATFFLTDWPEGKEVKRYFEITRKRIDLTARTICWLVRDVDPECWDPLELRSREEPTCKSGNTETSSPKTQKPES